MQLMSEKGVTGGICHSFNRYAIADNQYMKDYNESKESSHLKYWDVNNLYSWAMSRKLPIMFLSGLKIFLNLMKALQIIYNEETDEEYFLEVDAQYPEKLHDLHNDLSFLPKRMKIEIDENLITNLYDKTEYKLCYSHKKFKASFLNHGLVLKEVHRVAEFDQ